MSSLVYAIAFSFYVLLGTSEPSSAVSISVGAEEHAQLSSICSVHPTCTKILPLPDRDLCGGDGPAGMCVYINMVNDKFVHYVTLGRDDSSHSLVDAVLNVLRGTRMWQAEQGGKIRQPSYTIDERLGKIYPYSITAVGSVFSLHWMVIVHIILSKGVLAIHGVLLVGIPHKLKKFDLWTNALIAAFARLNESLGNELCTLKFLTDKCDTRLVKWVRVTADECLVKVRLAELERKATAEEGIEEKETELSLSPLPPSSVSGKLAKEH